MSEWVVLTIAKSKSVAFDDLDTLNADLLETSVGELLTYHDHDDPRPFLGFAGSGSVLGAGSVLVYDREVDMHALSAPVWYCFDKDAVAVIARHMKAGELELHVAGDRGGLDEYFRITPGAAFEGRKAIVYDKPIDLAAFEDEGEDEDEDEDNTA